MMTCVCTEGSRDPLSLLSWIDSDPALTYSTWMTEVRETIRQYLRSTEAQQGDGQAEGLKHCEGPG